MRARSVEGLQVYQRALAAADAISAMTNRPPFDRDPDLRRQLRSSSGGVPAHIAEGFGQKTNRHFAHYLYMARGTTHEVRTHLRIPSGRQYIEKCDRLRYADAYDEIARMLTGLIRHLERDDRPRRG
jgi:four helix bundle protein